MPRSTPSRWGRRRWLGMAGAVAAQAALPIPQIFASTRVWGANDRPGIGFVGTGGPATDLLVHVFTPVFCLLELGYPKRVLGGGGTFQYDREVPDQCNIIADYPGGPSVVMSNSLSNYTGIRRSCEAPTARLCWETSIIPVEESALCPCPGIPKR